MGVYYTQFLKIYKITDKYYEYLMNNPHNNKPELSAKPTLKPEASILHYEACRLKKDYYVDPLTGAMVFTEYYLKSRGHCCNNGCRHCPYK